MTNRDLPPVHPGEILLEYFPKPLEITLVERIEREVKPLKSAA